MKEILLLFRGLYLVIATSSGHISRRYRLNTFKDLICQ